MDEAMPLLVTADEQLLDDALRWCAAVGTVPEVAPDLTSARRSWRQASLVLVGGDLAPALATAGLSRREHVLVVAHDTSDLWPTAVALGAVAVFDRHDEQIVLESMATALDGRGEACLVSVVAGSGGAGSSTLAAGVALAGAGQGLASLLFDADPLGGGIDLVLGTEHDEGMRWCDLDGARGRLAAGALHEALPTRGGLATLSWGRAPVPALAPDAISTVLTAALHGFDLVVADVPRHLDPPSVDVVGRSVLTVLVVAEEVRALGAARLVLERLRQCAGPVALVTRSGGGGIGHRVVAETLGLPVLARMRPDRRLRSAVDHGRGPSRSRPVRRAARAVLGSLGLESS